METTVLTADQVQALCETREGHFSDRKSARISPGKLYFFGATGTAGEVVSFDPHPRRPGSSGGPSLEHHSLRAPWT